MPASSMACAASPPTAARIPSSASAVLRVYRKDYPTSAPPSPARNWPSAAWRCPADTLRRWLLAEGLWQRQRRRDAHRSRRPRRTCFGELVQMDTSIHDWTEGRGEDMVLIT